MILFFLLFVFIRNRRFQDYYSVIVMATNKTQGYSSWQSSSQSPVYLDTAYKQLLRQELKASALRNRTKVLNINQEHILKQVENNYSKLERLNQIKSNHTQQNQMLSKEKQKKSQRAEEQKKFNFQKRENHERQMTTILAQKNQEREKIRDEAKRMRTDNQRLIEANRSQEHSKKRQVRNKIHDDIMESRTTIKNFFANKHERIVLDTQQQIRKINQKRIKEQLMTVSCTAKTVDKMQHQIKQMKSVLKDSRLNIQVKKELSSHSPTKNSNEESHPLVKKIQTVMNIYTKFV